MSQGDLKSPSTQQVLAPANDKENKREPGIKELRQEVEDLRNEVREDRVQKEKQATQINKTLRRHANSLKKCHAAVNHNSKCLKYTQGVVDLHDDMFEEVENYIQDNKEVVNPVGPRQPTLQGPSPTRPVGPIPQQRKRPPTSLPQNSVTSAAPTVAQANLEAAVPIPAVAGNKNLLPVPPPPTDLPLPSDLFAPELLPPPAFETAPPPPTNLPPPNGLFTDLPPPELPPPELPTPSHEANFSTGNNRNLPPPPTYETLQQKCKRLSPEEARLFYLADFAFHRFNVFEIQFLQSQNLKAEAIYTAVFFKNGINVPVEVEMHGISARYFRQRVQKHLKDILPPPLAFDTAEQEHKLEESRLFNCAGLAFRQFSNSEIQYLQSHNLKTVVIYTAVMFKIGFNIPWKIEVLLLSLDLIDFIPLHYPTTISYFHLHRLKFRNQQ